MGTQRESSTAGEQFDAGAKLLTFSQIRHAKSIPQS